MAFKYLWFLSSGDIKCIGTTTYEEYKNHLESQFTEGMNWDNLGLGGWVVDHRLPNSAGKTEEEVLILNHHRNLQPMWAKDNIIKGDKYCPVELEAYFSEYLTK